ncbi:shikimate kinase [Haloarcula argentinensis]|uniref:Shikimate kinase n=1 Tax=Haloarcula argentinensis TaxID=43776 RepID=A0ABU2EYD0_HALAR|nr:shikimate kinase [Haloarcula argentinensis]EMA24617.1 shikimate kinase [Haloarcula argentinensis DSM 12282]MDS0253267.1 shikimate kinase [Haloarcula argentinensis]
MEGKAAAPAAGTVLNALATGHGAAFAIDEYTTATVTLSTETDGVTGEVADAPDADTRLIERCVEYVIDAHGGPQHVGVPAVSGGSVRTESEVPMASGLKSSSAAANATVMATLDALDATERMSREDMARLGVMAAHDVGVTVTGAFDDASASMLGGVTVTDNEDDALLAREEVDWDVLVWTPPEQSFSADADVERCRQIAPMARLVEDLALDGDYQRAMTVNGLAFSAALDFETDPVLDALQHVEGVSLSGTGPSFTAVGERAALEAVQDAWDERPGATWLTTTQTEGTHTV